MTDRIQRLRQESFNAQPSLSIERISTQFNNQIVQPCSFLQGDESSGM